MCGSATRDGISNCLSFIHRQQFYQPWTVYRLALSCLAFFNPDIVNNIPQFHVPHFHSAHVDTLKRWLMQTEKNQNLVYGSILILRTRNHTQLHCLCYTAYKRTAAVVSNNVICL